MAAATCTLPIHGASSPCPQTPFPSSTHSRPRPPSPPADITPDGLCLCGAGAGAPDNILDSQPCPRPRRTGPAWRAIVAFEVCYMTFVLLRHTRDGLYSWLLLLPCHQGLLTFAQCMFRFGFFGRTCRGPFCPSHTTTAHHDALQLPRPVPHVPTSEHATVPLFLPLLPYRFTRARADRLVIYEWTSVSRLSSSQGSLAEEKIHRAE